MAILGFEVEDIARVLALMEAGDLEEIEWEQSGRYLKVGSLRAPAQAPASTAHLEPALPASPARVSSGNQRMEQKSIAPKAIAEVAEDEIALVSPMVGVYYRSGKPGDPPMVEVGQVIARDQ